MSDKSVIEQAATLLLGDAFAILECHNVDPARPDWDGEPEAKAEYETLIRLHDALKNMSRRMRDAETTHSGDAHSDELLAALIGVLPFLTGDYWPGVKADAPIDFAIATVRKAEKGGGSRTHRLLREALAWIENSQEPAPSLCGDIRKALSMDGQA